MPWSVDAAEKERIRRLHPRIDNVHDLRPPPGRGPLYGLLYPLINRSSWVRAIGLTGLPIMSVRFRDPPDSQAPTG